jgi:hypothetical protein
VVVRTPRREAPRAGWLWMPPSNPTPTSMRGRGARRDVRAAGKHESPEVPRSGAKVSSRIAFAAVGVYLHDSTGAEAQGVIVVA